MGTPLEPKARQAREVIDRLWAAYPDAAISLEYDSRLQLLVAVVLSAQCPDDRVNAVTAELFETYHEPEDYVAAGADELANAIGSITYPNQKAGWIVEACERLIADHGGEVPETMDALTDLPGVGRKTANVVLQHGHDIVEGIAVDTHVRRVSRRLGLVEAVGRDAIERELLEVVPEEAWRDWTHLLISHGRAVCSARDPACEACVLEDICPSSQRDADVDLATNEPWA